MSIYLKKEFVDGEITISLLEPHDQGDYVLSEITITKEDIEKLMSYRNPLLS